MYFVLNENSESVFEASTFMEAANKAIFLYRTTKRSFSVVQEIWSVMMLEEENVIWSISEKTEVA